MLSISTAITPSNLSNKHVFDSLLVDTRPPSPVSKILPGHVQLLEKLCEASGGVVFLGRWNGALVRCKVLQSFGTDSLRYETRMAGLCHPNLVRYVADGLLQFSMSRKSVFSVSVRTVASCERETAPSGCPDCVFIVTNLKRTCCELCACSSWTHATLILLPPKLETAAIQ